MTPIQLSAEHLLRVHADKGQPLGSVLEGCVHAILGQVRLLRQIASEFSSFASSPQVKLAPVDLPELVAEILDPYRAGLAGRIEIGNDAAGPLPRVLVDRTLILRALANIVENALHAMPGAGELSVVASADLDTVVMTVRDTGVGMDDEALARVFEPYFSTKSSGTGLGLPIARRNVELSGGTIEVESRKGQGTTVRVRLPVARQRPGPEPRVRQANEGRRQIGVGEDDERQPRMRGDEREADRREEQHEVRPPPADVDRLDAAEPERAHHQERRHENHRERRERGLAILQTVRVEIHRGRDDARRRRARHARRNSACR